jgi:predicted nucleotide-binding protein
MGRGRQLPSDLAGVVYIPLDPTEAWRTRLARELRAAGLNINADAILT